MSSIQDAIKSYVIDFAQRQSQQTAETYPQGMKRFTEFLTASSRLPIDDLSFICSAKE